MCCDSSWQDYERSLLALVLWREARGEGSDGITAVACVIRNRVKAGSSYSKVITARWQFSSMTAPGDSQLIVWPQEGDSSFATCMQLANGVYEDQLPDITGGATHYVNLAVAQPSWANTMTKTCQIGHHTFFK